MADDLLPISNSFPAGTWPVIHCPMCDRGSLAPAKTDVVATARSESLRSHESWEPDWIQGFFHAQLRCNLPTCAEVVVVSGEMQVGPVLDSDGSWFGEYDELLLVRLVMPPLRLIQFPAKTPRPVRDCVTAASLVLWSDPSAAANRLRSAVEALLTARRVRKTNARGKRLTTHERITSFRSSQPVVADSLEAVKWIGNEGSHEEFLTVPEVLQGATLLGRALELLYDTTDAELARLAKRINKKKGVRRRR